MTPEIGIDYESVQSRPQVFVFIGPEGSGKTTQARLLSEKLGLPLVIYGDLLRERAESDPGEIGEACRIVFANHTYLDPSLMRRIAVERISQPDTINGIVLDGANRSEDETVHFSETLQMANRGDMNVITISLRLAGWKSMERLLGRKRDDDSVEGALNRLSKYYNRLGKRVSIMKNKWNFIQVDASQSIEEVHGRIMEKINNE